MGGAIAPTPPPPGSARDTWQKWIFLYGTVKLQRYTYWAIMDCCNTIWARRFSFTKRLSFKTIS